MLDALFMKILNQHWFVSHTLIRGRIHLYEHMDKWGRAIHSPNRQWLIQFQIEYGKSNSG